MEKDNREYLSKEKLQYELLREQKYIIPMLAFTLPLWTAILAFATWGVYSLSSTAWFFWGIPALLTVIFACSWVVGIVRLIVDRCLIKRGKFHAEIDYIRKMNSDKLTMSEILFHIWCVFDALFEGDWITIVVPHERDGRYVYFSGNRRAPISPDTRGLAGMGDSFYLVTLNNRRGRILRIYSIKSYRLDEE